MEKKEKRKKEKKKKGERDLRWKIREGGKKRKYFLFKGGRKEKLEKTCIIRKTDKDTTQHINQLGN
jgi:hypothetical protein